MSQSSQAVPTVTANIAGNKQQVNLRDYLNQRVAPFLKKAIHESLETEAEFPLQWLGEHLIQQSILYEGNPDRTNIRDRFVYKHEIPTTQAAALTNSTEVLVEPQAVAEPSMVVAPVINGEPIDPVISPPVPEVTSQANGMAEESVKIEEPPRDTEMGGTT